jgi:hypothetical protein
MIGVRLLLLSKYQKDGSPRLNDYLKLCATYCPDRRVLFNWVNEFKQASQLVSSQTEEAETTLNNASLETSEAYQQVSNIIKFDPSNNSVGLGVLNLENEPINEASPLPIVTETPLTPIESVENQPFEVEALTQHLETEPTKPAAEFGVIEFVVEEHAPEDLALPELPQDEEKAEEVVKIELGEVIEVAEPEAEEEEKITKATDSDSNVIFGNFEEDVFDAETFIPDFDNLLVTNTIEPLPDPANAAKEAEPLDTNPEYHQPIQPAVYVYEHPVEVADLRIDYFETEKEAEEEKAHEALIESLETTIPTETNEVIEEPKEEEKEQEKEDKNTSHPLIALEVLSEEKEQEQNTMDDEHFIQPKNGNKLVVSEFSSWLRTLKSKKESADESAEQKIIRNFKNTNAETTTPTPPKPTPPPAISQSNAIRNQIDKDENYMANNEGGEELFEQIEDLASKSIEDNNDIVSETLAQILTRQGKTDRALVMYKRLSVMFPDKKAYFSDIISKLSAQK